MKLGETLDGNISEYKPSHQNYLFCGCCCTLYDSVFLVSALTLVDQYDNVTKALTSTCVKHLSVEAEGLDKSAITFTWQVKKEKLKFFVKPRFKMHFTHTIFTLSQLSLNSMRLSLFPPHT